MWTIWGLYILSGAHLTILLDIGKILRHLGSNGCLSLSHILILPVLRGYLKYDILHEML